MFINRTILAELIVWKNATNRKPLIIRGARQVGKTTIINEFGKTYNQYIYLNLDKIEDAAIFENYETFSKLVEKIFFIKNKSFSTLNTLLFIDEIQAKPEAINLLRYFFEEFPELNVIAAGSLLETILDEKVNIPVGRVEYKVLRPLNFNEFLDAMDEKSALTQFHKIPMDSYAHSKMMQLFNTYTLIGGMPEIIQHYAINRNLLALTPIYESLIESYMNDVEKYARNSSMVQVIRHVIKSMSSETGSRIKFEKFGQSSYKSKEVGEALRTLEKALILHLIYPNISVTFPIIQDLKKSPRLQILDTGLLNYMAGIQKEILLNQNIESVYQGKVVEHIVGQELLALKFNVLYSLNFWTRENKDSNAEIDFIYGFEGELIPIEIKSGATGRLRSLHLFMEASPNQYAIRLYGGELGIDKLSTPNGKIYFLLNLPYFLVGKIDDYLNWFIQQIRE
jgi:uncharacterized protein